MAEIKYEVNEGGCHICTSHAVHKSGYPRIGYKGRVYYLNRFMYEQTYGEIPDGLVVRHTCDNRTCINPEHLELGTVADNNNDCVVRGRKSVGESTKKSKLTNEAVKDIMTSNESARELSLRYGVDRHTITAVKRGKTWRHLGYDPITLEQSKGEDVWSAKLTEEDVKEIKRLLKSGSMKQKDVADLFNVSRSVINKISKGFAWKHVV